MLIFKYLKEDLSEAQQEINYLEYSHGAFDMQNVSSSKLVKYYIPLHVPSNILSPGGINNIPTSIIHHQTYIIAANLFLYIFYFVVNEFINCILEIVSCRLSTFRGSNCQLISREKHLCVFSVKFTKISGSACMNGATG